MRIACLQFAPQLGDIDNNLNRADAVLSKANPIDLDLLVLPELAFSGFNFKSLQQITPYLEPKGSGITSLWARTVALKYDCVVCAGYPEKVDPSVKWPTGPEYYNSTIVVNGDGETIGNYRKSFLYTDEAWALEGPKGFYADIIPGLGNTSIGICMDLNPYKFETPWHAFEFAFHVLDSYSNLVIITMAWITREDGRAYSRAPQEPDMETLTYWVTRLEPLIRSDNQDEIIVVFCNRTGTEGEATYTGTSAVLGILEGEVRVYGMLGRGEKSLLVVDTNNPPRAKMVYRPEGEEEETSSQHQPPQGLNPGSRSVSASPAPSSVRSAPRHAPPLSPRPPVPPPAPVRASSYQESSSQPPLKRDQGTSYRREMSIKTSRPDDDDDGGIPTPSAPSPTPLAMRPKIVIPDSAKSPNSSAMDDFSEPPSAISLRSQDSNTSTRSNASGMSGASGMSKASESTVRSLTRAPEDSTPYPHSGVPRSEPFSPNRKIFSGSVTFDHPGDDNPASRKSYWTPSPSISRTPEAFPWPPLRQRTEPMSAGPVEGPHYFTWDHLRQQDTSSAQSRERKAANRKSNASLDSDKTSKFFTPGQPAPTSRSASRNQMGETLTPNGMMDPIVSFAQQTAHLIPGADAAERIRGIASSDSPIPERPSSPKSRNASRSRPSATPDLVRRGTASPEQLRRPGTRSPELQRSHSAAIQVYASPSMLIDDATADSISEHGRAAESVSGTPIPTSLDAATSTPPDARYSGGSSSSADGGRSASHGQQRPSRAERLPSQQRRRPSVQDHDFERIEEVVSGDCPVHGASSRTTSVSETPDTAASTAAAVLSATAENTSTEPELTQTSQALPSNATTPVPVTQAS
ncbi:carbon-nitrogen hydrolase domain-containing protein [Sarocladium implicatum]|nr:carbon-nitrogen hydrolase domain-containing protein [Sarocladium implicatum]